ncbi:MAG TPA: phosphoglycerate dehydrogenase [Planctomycetaceae bacterium]|nr:phosphoglycerate dehydrogenase [Planctomycetaceae bacterium]
MPRVLVTSLNGELGPHISLLPEHGFEVEVVDRKLNLADENSLIEATKGFQAVIAGSERWTARVLEALPELRVIARSGVGFDAVDTAACDRLGIVVATTPGVNHHAVAEHTIAMLMGIARGFPWNDMWVRRGHWDRVGGPRVMGRTIGLVGLGRIGQATATRAAGLGMKVIAFEPYPDENFIVKWGIELVDLDTLFSTADYVSLHCPASAENRHLINAARLKQMKNDAVLINTARGALVDEKALIDALQNKQIRAAGLDVFEVEPLPLDSPLIGMENVLLSGHIAGLDHESHDDTFTLGSEIIISLHKGEWPAHCIQNLKGVSDWKWER